MTATTLPTSRPVTQNWNMDFKVLNGKYYPNGFYSSIGWKGHNGIDYGCWEGDPVEAVCDGVIEFAGNGNNHPLLTGGGNAVLLRNDELGVRFEYLHLLRFEVREGQRVSRSQVIARSGNTGISTAPHLHLGAIPVRNVDVNNGYRGRIDPTPYLYGNLNPDYAGSGAVGPQGSITPSEEDDVALTDKQARALDFLAEHGGRMKQILEAVDERTGNSETGTLKKAADLVLEKINPTNWPDGKPMYIAAQADIDGLHAAIRASEPAKYFRGTGEDKTVYQNVDGVLRSLTYDEWVIEQAKGERFADIDPLWIDKLKEEGA